MELFFLGTGTSQGVPMIAHHWPGLNLEDPRNWRTRASVHVVMDGVHIQVDAAPEFRLQCLRERVEWLDLFILTHGHADHIQGMDDLRRFCDLREFEALPVYSTPAGLQRIREIYPYAIRDRPEFFGYPAFRLAEMPSVLETRGGTIHCSLLPHGPVTTLGLVFTERSSGRRLAYYTDCKEVPEEARALARGADVIVLDALRYEPHATHMSIEEAVAVAEDLRGGRTFFTHMTCMVDHATAQARLPAGRQFAWDGLRLRV